MGGNRNGGPVDQRVAALAGRQYGVASRRQLLEIGLSHRAIERRLQAGRLHRLHYGVYSVGHELVPPRGRWLAAVLTFDGGAVLSHRSAAALWGLVGSRRGPVEVTVGGAQRRPDIRVHRGALRSADSTELGRIPVTAVGRTILDLADVEDDARVARVAEEADRLGVLSLQELEELSARSPGRRGLRVVRRVLEEARAPDGGRSALERRLVALCREHRLPPPMTNVSLLGHEVDAYWPQAKLVVEADGFAFHAHRAAFERDRARDAAMQAEGFHVIRVTHRRLEREPETVASQLRHLLRAKSGGAGPADG